MSLRLQYVVISGAAWSAMAADLGWMSGHTSSLDITIISIFFLVVYITLYTLCTTCYSGTPECPEEKELPSSLSLSVNLEDQWSTHRTMNNVDAKSDSYFSQQMTPRIPDTPTFSVKSTGSFSARLPSLPPIPPVFYLTTLQVEPPMVSSSGQQPRTVKTVWDGATPPPEDQPNMNSGSTETVSEGYPYAFIDNVRVSGPSSPSAFDDAYEDQWERESPYYSVKEWTEHATTYDLTSVTDSQKPEELKFNFPPLPGVPDDQVLINTDRTAIYAVVNRKNKSIKEAPVVQDMMVLDEDEAPPIPEKNI
ncbi:uncharacterized protein LOC108257523 [Ictalurus punctatus]|uniref:Uncharacterized protein LOC108257523 n=1 Tax=Ictalurus punctatus TaxID=7998 RepID=A0A2D0PZK9_ICTPU|nr:uncharacterized protein LOC108257523 [Ictalurus punctatus]